MRIAAMSKTVHTWVIYIFDTGECYRSIKWVRTQCLYMISLPCCVGRLPPADRAVSDIRPCWCSTREIHWRCLCIWRKRFWADGRCWKCESAGIGRFCRPVRRTRWRANQLRPNTAGTLSSIPYRCCRRRRRRSRWHWRPPAPPPPPPTKPPQSAKIDDRRSYRCRRTQRFQKRSLLSTVVLNHTHLARRGVCFSSKRCFIRRASAVGDWRANW